MKKQNIPNALSIIRIFMVPVFVLLFLTDYPERIVPAIIVFILAGATDIIDGYIARRFGWSSKLGQILDPLADKLIQVSAFVCLYIVKLIPFWMLLIYALKEMLLGIGAAVIFRKQKVVVKSNIFGKAASVVVFLAVFIISLFGEILTRQTINLICIFVIVFILFAAFVYFLQNYKISLRSQNSKSER